MKRKDLLFYKEYEKFYTMAEKSLAFSLYCKDAFGKDFSQDGFSDINQINMILNFIPNRENVNILDIGCGNGKLLGYLREKTNCNIYGFDYSKKAIRTAKGLHPVHSEFRQGIIGEIDYTENFFDVIISMDTIYFAKDMSNFVAQVKSWLKPQGIFFIGYQEGDVMPKTKSLSTTEIAKCLEINQMKYKVFDITTKTYEMLKKKRESAKAHYDLFCKERNKMWFDMLMFQTECAEESLESFEKKMSRYIFVAKK